MSHLAYLPVRTMRRNVATGELTDKPLTSWNTEKVGTISDSEFNAIAHLRGWCHEGANCPLH